MHFLKIAERIIKIQSVSDLITNSSSEAFVVYTKEGIQLFKDIVSTLIEDNFDNHFILELDIDEWYRDDYETRPEEEKDLSFEDWCFKHDVEDIEGCTYVKGFIITAKDPKDLDKANKLNQIYSIFETETRYC